MQERNPSDNKNFSFTIPIEDFICPITSQVFFEPNQAMPCGHIFEMEAINKWRNTSVSCPCCRQPIDAIYPAPSYFKKLFKEFLEKNPKFENERYFNFETFENAFQNNGNIQPYLDLFKVATKQFNSPSEEKKSEGLTPLALFAKNERGFNLLITEPKLRENITEEGLNTAIKVGDDRGIAALYWFTIPKNIHRILVNDEKFRSKITSDGLNSVFEEEGPLQGVSPIFALCTTVSGRKVLKENDALRAKISSFGLNHVVLGESYVGDSAVNYLAGSDDGIEILINDLLLREKITPEGLNSYKLLGEDAGVTTVSWLILSDLGIELLSQDENLLKKISAEGINMAEQGRDKDASAIYWLLATAKGREIFARDKRIRSLISEEALHRMVSEGHNAGLSPAYWLKSFCQDVLIGDYILKMKYHREGRFPLDNFFKDSKIKVADLEFLFEDQKENKSRLSLR